MLTARLPPFSNTRLYLEENDPSGRDAARLAAPRLRDSVAGFELASSRAGSPPVVLPTSDATDAGRHCTAATGDRWWRARVGCTFRHAVGR
jgi:hypothetical protein